MKKTVLFLLAAILAAACQPAATHQPALLPPMWKPISGQTPALVESLAGSVDDLAGIWIFTLKLQFRDDGTTRLYRGSDSNPDLVDEGSFTFNAGKLTFTTTSACKDPATYEAHVTKQQGRPIWLRLDVVGNDACTGRSDILSRPGKFYKP